jgi:hypothetical protein
MAVVRRISAHPTPDLLSANVFCVGVKRNERATEVVVVVAKRHRDALSPDNARAAENEQLDLITPVAGIPLGLLPARRRRRDALMLYEPGSVGAIDSVVELLQSINMIL